MPQIPHLPVGLLVTRPFVISIVGLAVAVAALALALSLDNVDEVPPASAVSAVAAVAEGVGSAPDFDVVRLGEKGDAVLAGHAVPGAEVRILDGGRELGRAVADIRGEWVFVPTGPLPAGARALTLSARNPDGAMADGAVPVILVVLGQGEERPLALKPLTGGGIRLLNGLPGSGGRLSIDLLDHGGSDRLFIAGRAPAGAAVHVHAGDRLIGRTLADGEGLWRLDALAPSDGVGALRADVVDGKGKVVAQVEVSAQGEPVRVADEAGAVHVAAGPAQWRIARKLAGGGVAVTVVFAPED